MNVFDKLLLKLNGLDYRQEYLCLAKESFQQPLHVYLLENNEMRCDITNLHGFVGYCPLVFAFPSELFKGSAPALVRIAFCPVHQNGFLREKDAIALLILKKIDQQPVYKDIAVFYEGVKGTHRFLSVFHQMAIAWHNRLYGKKPGNVFLKGNLYHQVQIAYSVPRKICLITVAQNDNYNLLPTDLHGQINDQYYVISLRHEGQACRQVEASGRIVLSDMDVHAFRKVYGLGKNHMQPLKEPSAFDFSAENSKVFGLPLPKNILAYKELEVVSSFNKGIHKLILFKIVHLELVDSRPATLAHIHNCYATWRNKRGLQSNYLLR
jgi:flavin reductase (DIM6/NTAB) family NADH-FMN oxidoreductase RutF